MISSELAFTMILINLDRFFLACSPVFYEEYFKMSTMKKLTVGSLIMSLANALIFTLNEQLDGEVDYEGIVMLTVFCLLFTATCVVVAVKLIKSHHLFGLYRYYRVNKQERISISDFIVCFLVSLTYIAFYCIPAPWYHLHVKSKVSHDEDTILVYEAIEAGYVLVYVLHPLLCIVLVKEFRNKVVNQCMSGGEQEVGKSSGGKPNPRWNFNKVSVRSNTNDMFEATDEMYIRQLNDLFGRQTGNVEEWHHGRIA